MSANGAVVSANGTGPSSTLRALRARVIWSLKLRVWRVLDRVRHPAPPPPVLPFTAGGEGSRADDTLIAPSYGDLAVPREQMGNDV